MNEAINQRISNLENEIAELNKKLSVLIASSDEDKFSDEQYAAICERCGNIFAECTAKNLQPLYSIEIKNAGEGGERSQEKRPIILEAQRVWITYKGKLPGRITGSLKTPPKW